MLFFISKNIYAQVNIINYTLKSIAYVNYWICTIALCVTYVSVNEENIVLYKKINVVPCENWDRKIYILSNDLSVNNRMLKDNGQKIEEKYFFSKFSPNTICLQYKLIINCLILLYSFITAGYDFYQIQINMGWIYIYIYFLYI